MPTTRHLRRGGLGPHSSGSGLLVTHSLLAYLFVFPLLGRPAHLSAWVLASIIPACRSSSHSWKLEVKGFLVGPCALFRGHSPEPSSLSRERKRQPILELGKKLRLHRGEVTHARSHSQTGPLWWMSGVLPSHRWPSQCPIGWRPVQGLMAHRG